MTETLNQSPSSEDTGSSSAEKSLNNQPPTSSEDTTGSSKWDGVKQGLLKRVEERLEREEYNTLEATDMALYLESLAKKVRRGDLSIHGVWFRLLKDHPYITVDEVRNAVRDEYCEGCGKPLTTEPDGSTICERCFIDGI